MEKVKSTNEYQIFKKRSGRFAVVNKEGKFVNGEAKRDILAGEKLIKVMTATKKAEAAPTSEEASAEG